MDSASYSLTGSNYLPDCPLRDRGLNTRFDQAVAGNNNSSGAVHSRSPESVSVALALAVAHRLHSSNGRVEWGDIIRAAPSGKLIGEHRARPH
jgi:hypothetical protein